MAENNFYEWLGLSVEHFESDPAKLAPILEKLITDWNSSKDIKFQNRAAIYQTAMRAAIQDPEQWKRIYEEYKHSVDDRIVDALMMCADSLKRISSEQVSAIATNYKVTISYVEKVAKANGYDLGSTSGPIPQPVANFSLKDLEPDSKAKGQLDSIQKSINELGFATLAELIEDQLVNEINLNTIPKGDLLDALQRIKAIWKKVSANGDKHQQKSHYDRICSGMLGFFKSYETTVYVQYLNWKSVNDILNAIRTQLTKYGLDALNNEKYNKTIDDIYSVIGDREKAQSILDSFCTEKNIPYPRPLPNVAVCPYCSNSFEKSNPLQSNCPSCNKSFVVPCPKCGKKKNFLSENNCDGIDLLQYPYLERQLQATQQMLDTLDISAVKFRTEEISKKWPNFPGCTETINKCRSLENSYGTELKKLRTLCDTHHYYEAKKICDRLGATYPKFKTAHRGIYESIVMADSLYKTSKSENDTDKKVEILLDVLALVADHPEANADIKIYKLSPIQGLNGNVSSDGAAVVLSWSSQNKPNSVYYTILRKHKTPISNSSDGEEISVTQSTSFSDSDIVEGEVYYYAVYANRGPLQTPICATSNALILLKKPDVQITPNDSSVSVSWQHSSIEVKAFVSENPIQNYGEGTLCKGLTPSGFDIDNLSNGTKYYIGIAKVLNHLGVEYHSDLSVYSFTPMESIKPPEISKAIGAKDGEYIITHLNPTDSANLELYYSTSQARITGNSTLNLSDLRKELRKATVSNLGNHQYSISMNGSTELYIYPVICRGEVATVGAYLCLRYAKSIKIKKGVVSGNKLCLYIDNWVDGADTLFICYNDDVYPQDKNDVDKKISISKIEFDRTRILEIQNVQNQKYYISIFARKSGEYIPVCNYFFDNSSKSASTINYSFQVGLLGTLSIILDSTAVNLPAIDVCVDNCCVPLTKQGGKVIYTIPAGLNGNATVKVPNYTVKKNTYAKLFTDDTGFILRMKSGNGKIK